MHKLATTESATNEPVSTMFPQAKVSGAFEGDVMAETASNNAEVASSSHSSNEEGAMTEVVHINSKAASIS